MTDLSGGDEIAARTALSFFGISDARLAPLTGGTLNRVFRVDSARGVFVLKEYGAESLKTLDPRSVFEAHETAQAHGLPVPAMSRSADGQAFVAVGHSLFTVATFVSGRAYSVDAMPELAAYRMGVMLARLQAALTALSAGEAPALWSRKRIRAYLEELLVLAETHRPHEAVDERAAVVIRQKLTLLGQLDEAPAYEPGWTHGDYHWRNVLFDEGDEVVGIIDFDTVAYYSPARDVMRCIALSFPSLGPSAFSFFKGYAAERGVSPEEARGYVAFYRYISSYRVWPVSMRYQGTDKYDPRWDEMIQPFPDWDWTMLSERFAEIAARAAADSDVRL